MEYSLTAIAVSPTQLDLPYLSGQLGIRRKLRWEEPLILSCHELAAANPGSNTVWLYNFGAIVFCGCTSGDIALFIKKTRALLSTLPPADSFTLRETCRLVETEDTGTSDSECVRLPAIGAVELQVACLIIAKSVALESIEHDIDIALDEVEPLIARIESGDVSIKARVLYALSGRFIKLKHRSISYIMAIDKPDLVWDNHDADRLYGRLSQHFEISNRYHDIKHKTDMLLGTTEVFASIAHAHRSSRLEWIIIILIAVEILISLIRW